MYFFPILNSKGKIPSSKVSLMVPYTFNGKRDWAIYFLVNCDFIVIILIKRDP